MHPVVEEVTENIRRRSKASRRRYLEMCRKMRDDTPPKRTLSCGNMAHGYAACSDHEKQLIGSMSAPNIGIINAYNDMLSAHQPLADYPAMIKAHALKLGATAQVASGVPAMCDGVTQGQPGMELSLFSRDVVAMATAIGLSHNLFDATLCLGICDKIVPGMLIGALQFGHLRTAFIGSGPMATGLPNKEKAAVRQQYAAGTADEAALLAVESASYHSAGTCTFYGTANTNQVMMEVLGLQLPGSSFLHPEDPLRPALTQRTVAELVTASTIERRLCDVVTEASLVNAVVAILATGGSTNHTLHLVAIAQAAGIDLTWEDMDELSRIVPLLARVYPNGSADVNDFQAAGGTAYVVQELRSGRLLNEDVVTLLGEGLDPYACTPAFDGDHGVQWSESVPTSRRLDVLRSVGDPFAVEGGLRSLTGNLGHCIIKTSAVEESHQAVEAPCRVFDSQEGLKLAFEAGELDRDVVAVVRFQGPVANGMPELHKMTPYLGELQDRGFNVALITDGRMSGASGKVPAAIHLSPEAIEGGPIGQLRDGDVIALDAHKGQLNVLLSMEELESRPLATQPSHESTLGRNLFDVFRRNISKSTRGATVFGATADVNAE